VTFDETIFPERGDDNDEIFRVESDIEDSQTIPNAQVNNQKSNHTKSDEDEPELPSTQQDQPKIIKVTPPKPPINHPDHPNYIRRSTRIGNQPKRAYLTTTKKSEDTSENTDPKFEPKRFKEIQHSKFKSRWIEACNKEIKEFSV
jgi:hypothetical protein